MCEAGSRESHEKNERPFERTHPCARRPLCCGRLPVTYVWLAQCGLLSVSVAGVSRPSRVLSVVSVVVLRGRGGCSRVVGSRVAVAVVLSVRVSHRVGGWSQRVHASEAPRACRDQTRRRRNERRNRRETNNNRRERREDEQGGMGVGSDSPSCAFSLWPMELVCWPVFAPSLRRPRQNDRHRTSTTPTTLLLTPTQPTQT